VLSGWLALHHDLPAGSQHVLRLLLPGDLFGYESYGLAQMAHGVLALTDASICAVSNRRLAALRARYRDLNERFIWLVTRDGRARDMMHVGVVHGSAIQRVSVLLADLARRLKRGPELAPGDVFRAPLTQALIGAATGLTQIHVNRVLRRLRERHILLLHGGQLNILDPSGLLAIAGLERELEAEPFGAPLRPAEAV
jgi:CRP/FNR family transcriptional regulator, anaerobic regulatory protein